MVAVVLAEPTIQLADLAGLVAVEMVVLTTPQEARQVVLDRQILVVVVGRKVPVRKQIHRQHLALADLALLF